MMDSSRIDNLTQILMPLIPSQGERQLSEYDLIIELRKQQVDEFVQFNLANNMDLFRCHFLLYHMLYRIREQWLADKKYHLEISALQIQKLPLSDTHSQTVGHHDALRDYYLDFSEFHSMELADVEILLRGFWSKMIEPESRERALITLELQDPVTDKEIKHQYRKLAMIHHPDRGGSAERLQQINEAIKILSA